MKLLIVTQAVDNQDPLLGFFVRWVAELASRVERVEVICLWEGVHTLPENVRVHSLGKERGISRVSYVVNFYRYLYRLRGTYTAVLVHMNPEYMLLGGLYWRARRTRCALWYNHPYSGLRLRLAVLLANTIFYTSPFAATACYKKAKQMPAGIDTDLFRPLREVRHRAHIYMQGRLMPSKRVEVALQALRILRMTVPTATLSLVGPEDQGYGQALREDFADLLACGAVEFAGPRVNHTTPASYARAGASVNLAASGHLDKSVLESMACETPVVLSSTAFKGMIPSEWIVPEGDAEALAEALARLIALPPREFVALARAEREAVIRTHSLRTLVNELVRDLSAVL